MLLSLDFKGLLSYLVYTSHLTPAWLKLDEGNHPVLIKPTDLSQGSSEISV